MSQMDEIAGRKRELLRVCSGYQVLAVYLFGSMADEGVGLLDNKMPVDIDPLADLDVGVVFLLPLSDPKERVKLYKRLYSDLSDVFYPLSLDLVFLQETGVIIQSEAINGQLIYSRDDDQRTDYEERVIKFYQDWKPVYDQYTKEVLEAIRT
ncbi:MAG: nucleotidyltransferase domain-containing protein [Nitrospirae bacterium]|nr:nucleotidyltransferase domain-containing protein [Nitrospirota bacterium]